MDIKSGQLFGQNLFQLHAQHPTIPDQLRRALSNGDYATGTGAEDHAIDSQEQAASALGAPRANEARKTASHEVRGKFERRRKKGGVVLRTT